MFSLSHRLQNGWPRNSGFHSQEGRSIFRPSLGPIHSQQGRGIFSPSLGPIHSQQGRGIFRPSLGPIHSQEGLSIFRPSLGPIQLPNAYYRRETTVMGLKWPGFERDHSPLPRAQVRNKWSHNFYSPYTFME
jgi:hypothetical protein